MKKTKNTHKLKRITKHNHNNKRYETFVFPFCEKFLSHFKYIDIYKWGNKITYITLVFDYPKI